MSQPSTFLVFGATGQTGQHFVSLALEEGQSVRAFVRNPAKLAIRSPHLVLQEGSITNVSNLDELLEGVDFVISMLGDAKLQRHEKINTSFVRKLIPAMRRQGVKRFLYQAGALTRRYKERLPLVPWILRNTLARFGGLIGQHEDNQAVIEYLVEEAQDMEWIVHRAAIASDGPSKGVLERSKSQIGLATFGDCAAYNYRTLLDPLCHSNLRLELLLETIKSKQMTPGGSTSRGRSLIDIGFEFDAPLAGNLVVSGPTVYQWIWVSAHPKRALQSIF